MVELGSVLRVLEGLLFFSKSISRRYMCLNDSPAIVGDHRGDSQIGFQNNLTVERGVAQCYVTAGISMSPPSFPSRPDTDDEEGSRGGSSHSDANHAGEIDDMMDSEGYAGPALPEKVVKPLTPEALAAFNTVQARSGVIYISRIPPGMQPAKVRHLLSQYGEVGRVYLQQEGQIVKPMSLIFAKNDG